MPAFSEILFTALPHFPIWSDIVVEEHKCLPAPLRVFVFQLKMSHGSVPKSGPKLLQMFSNERLQCQHKPTSTFAFYIFLFDVVQMRFTVRPTHYGLRRNPRQGDFYFVDREKLSECGFVCQHKTLIRHVVIRLFERLLNGLSELVPVVKWWLEWTNIVFFVSQVKNLLLEWFHLSAK